jgi:endo-1,4-beta-xylanase
MRCFAGLILAAAVAAGTLEGQSLRSLADERGIRIGAAVAPMHLGEEGYASALAREFSQAEPENAMKFGPIHPQPKSYEFGPADAVVEFAQAHKMAVRGHTLVWHNQVAPWVKAGNYTPEQLSAILKEHIDTVVGRYAGKVYAWDVVNEAYESDGSLRKTVWSDTPGYLERAFRWAHAADPKALLFYNDFSAEVANKKSDAIYEMAKDFKSRGVPIDGIGMQMHIGLKPGSLASMEANMKRITDLGLQVQITELDVKLPVDASGIVQAESLENQARVYGDIVAMCLRNPKCTAIQIWGFTDRYSWIPRSSKGFGAALPFDENYRPKPAYQAIVEALRKGK